MRAWTVAEHSRATGDSSRTGAPTVASATPPPCLQNVGDVRATNTRLSPTSPTTIIEPTAPGLTPSYPAEARTHHPAVRADPPADRGHRVPTPEPDDQIGIPIWAAITPMGPYPYTAATRVRPRGFNARVPFPC